MSEKINSVIMTCHEILIFYVRFQVTSLAFKGAIIFAVAIWPVTGQGVKNTKWPAVLYSQQISQNRKTLAKLNYHMSI